MRPLQTRWWWDFAFGLLVIVAAAAIVVGLSVSDVDCRGGRGGEVSR